MKKQEHNTTKTSFLTKFKNTKIGVKVIIIGGILALVATTIIVPIVVANKGDSSNPKPNVDNRENDNNEDDNNEDDNNEDDNNEDDNNEDDNNEDNNNEDNNNEDDNNEDDNQQGKTDSYVQWHAAYNNDRTTTNFDNATQSEHDYINDQISITEGTHFGNQAFKEGVNYYIPFNAISKIGTNKDEVLKNKANDKIVGTSIKFLGYDFGTSKTFANVFYHLKEDSTKWYYETIRITGFGAPKILPSNDASIASYEFYGMVLPKDFNVSSDLSTIRDYAFKYTSFTKDAKFSLYQTQVKSIPRQAFYFAKLPNGFALNSETNSIESNAFYGTIFDKEANFSLAQTQVKSISNSAFASATLPNAFALSLVTSSIEKSAFWGTTFTNDAKFSLAQTQVKSIPEQAFTLAKLPNAFALNPATTSIALEAFADAYLNPKFKIPNTVTSISQRAFLGAILPSGYAWYDKDDNKQTITATNYPKAGWYVGKI